MAEENSLGSPNGRSQHDGWEKQNWPEEDLGTIEQEWRQVSATYAGHEHPMEWDNSAVSNELTKRPLPIENREARITRIHHLIRHCRRIAIPVTTEILSETPGQMEWELNGKSSIAAVQKLLQEFESEMRAAEIEAKALEAEALGEHEFQAELNASEQAHELALSEVLASEATHAATENEAQSLLGTALPISISVVGSTSPILKSLPDLTHANAKLVSTLFNSGHLSREALALLPTIQRRTVATLKAAQQHPTLSPDLTSRIFSANTAKVLTSPTIIGKAMIRNQAIRENTMPACSRQ